MKITNITGITNTIGNQIGDKQNIQVRCGANVNLHIVRRMLIAIASGIANSSGSFIKYIINYN